MKDRRNTLLRRVAGQCVSVSLVELKKAVATLFFATLFGLPLISHAKVIGIGKPVTALEMTQLPQYCLGQVSRDFRGPQFTIGGQFPNCGPGMNHFCPGIIAFNRANRPGADGDHRSYWLGVARAEFSYTVGAMRPYPNCGLREHLNVWLRLLEAMPKR